MQMNEKPDELKSESGPRRNKRKQPKAEGKISPGAIAKMVRDAYKKEPERILDVSPELFRLLSESEMERKSLDRQSYFENYITERERNELYSRLMSIAKEHTFNKEDSVKILELAVPLGLANEEIYKPIVLKAFQNLGIELKQEKDVAKVIKRGEAANRIEVYRGVILSYDWGGALLDISVTGKEILICNAAQSLAGALAWVPESTKSLEGVEWSLNGATSVVLDDSALFSIVNSKDPCHKRATLEFMRIIERRGMILCAVETLVCLISKASLHFGVSKAEEVAKLSRHLFRIVVSLTAAKNEILSLALSEACRGVMVSSLYAILLSRMTGSPLFATDRGVIEAWSSVRRLGRS